MAGIIKKLQARIRVMMACHRFVILRQIADAYHKELAYRRRKCRLFIGAKGRG